MSDQQIKTTCPYCGVGCGVTASVAPNGEVCVSGDDTHPANQGRLCSKGSALAETLLDGNRLLKPVVNKQITTWDAALDHVATSLAQTIETYGRESVAFYVSGQLLTEDYYVVNKLSKGWFGTANIDSNSRLCMASSVMGHKRSFGTDTVPGCYEDLEVADLIVLVGSNLAWCHPVLYQRIAAEKQRRPELFLVVIDPRRTATADMADLHLAIHADGDTLLFNGLLAYLDEQGLCDKAYVSAHVDGFDTAILSAKECVSKECATSHATNSHPVKTQIESLHTSQTMGQSKDIPASKTSLHQICLRTLAQRLGLKEKSLAMFYEKIAGNPKTITLFSQGVNQSSSGTDKVSAIINTHLATGRIGKPGMGPFSITGQPNAMGGREVGGLATMLAAHMELSNSEHRRIVQQFWQSPHIANTPGLCAVDLFNAVAVGSIKAIWIMGTNPVVSMPDANRVRQALAACPLVIVSDVIESTDTLALADVMLPAQAWGEKDGTVTNSERCISRQRAINPPAGGAMPDWWALSQVAQRMNFGEGFNYQRAADIFREHAALSSLQNNGSRDFDIGAAASLSNTDYEQLAPFYWPWVTGKAPTQAIRFFSKGQFFTANSKAQMQSVAAATPGNTQLSDNYPMTLNTGRIRDQWHTMTRTGYSPKLSSHMGEPFMELNPQDALLNGISDADIIKANSEYGTGLFRASVSERQKPGQVFSPIHWTDVFSSNARTSALIAPQTDPYSRQPAFKNQPVSIQRFNASSYAYVLHRHTLPKQALTEIQYWALSPVEQGWRYEMASELSVDALQALLASLCGATTHCEEQQQTQAERQTQQIQELTQLERQTQQGQEQQGQQEPNTDKYDICTDDNNSLNTSYQSLSITDPAARKHKFALFQGAKLQTLILVADEPVEISRSWAQRQLAADWSNRSQRYQLLAGRAPTDQPDIGAIVCSCFQVGATQIVAAITQHQCHSLKRIGHRLQAGTNCGSCRSEIQSLINRQAQTLKRKCTTSPSRIM